MLKRMLSLIMAMAVMLTVVVFSPATVSAAPTLELVFSTDLETDADSYAGGNVTVETEHVHSEATAIKKTKASEYDYTRLAGATNKMEMGKTYKFSFWIKVISGSADTYTVSLVPSVDWSAKWGFMTAKSDVALGEWTKVEKNFTLDQDWASACNMDVQVGGADTVYAIDDIEMYEVVPDASVLYETGFEDGIQGNFSNSVSGAHWGFEEETTIVHSGSKAVRYVKTGEYVYSGIEGFKGKFEIGKRYKITFWAYIVSGTTSNGTYTCRMVPGYSSFSTAKSGIPQGEWTKVEYIYNSSSELGAGGIMGIDFVGPDIDYIIDDVEISELPFYETGFEGNISNDSTNVYGGESQAANIVHSGSYSLKKVKDNEDSFIRLTGFDKMMVLNKAYRFSLWVYVESGSDETYSFNFIPVSDWSTYRGRLLAKDNIPKGEWVNIEYDFTFDPTNYGKNPPSGMWTMMFDMSGTDTVYYIDDIKVVQTTPPMAIVESVSGLKGKDGTGVKGLTVSFSQAVTSDSATATTSYTINGSSDLIKSVTNVAANQFYVEFTNILPEGFYLFGVNGVVDALSGNAVDSYILDFECVDEIRTDVRIYKDYGTEAQYAITDGALMSGKLTASVDMFGNYVNEATAPVVAIALYNNGRLVSVKTESTTLGAYSDLAEALATAEITVPEFDDESYYTVKAFLWDAADNAPYIKEIILSEPEITVISVDPSNEGSNFKSPAAANEWISDNGPLNQYIIDIAPGVYTEVNWTVKPYVTLRGQDRDTCILRGRLEEDADPANIEGWSTINMYGTAGLENLTITAQNLRYPVHDEGSGYNKNAYRTVKNCVIEHLGNDEAIEYWAEADSSKFVWPYISPWGYGSASGVVAVFDDSQFKSTMRGWYVHNNKDFEFSQNNVLRNCTTSETGSGVAVQVENLGSGTDDHVVLENCKFGGQYVSFSDAPYITQDPELQTASHIDYSVKVENCDPLGFISSNRGRALKITSNSTDADSSVEASGAAADCLLGDYTAINGGGGANGYLYGYWDISGIPVGVYSDLTTDNTLGKRLGDCSNAGKKLVLTFDNAETVEIVFNRNYTAALNSVIIDEINAAIEGLGVAEEYDVDANEYYPEFVDKEFVAENNGDTYIERFSPVYLKADGSVALMTSDDATFAGITLDRILPGESGRILKEGYLYAAQMGVDEVNEGDNFTVDENGNFVKTTSGGILFCDNDNGWALFSAL